MDRPYMYISEENIKGNKLYVNIQHNFNIWRSFEMTVYKLQSLLWWKSNSCFDFYLSLLFQVRDVLFPWMFLLNWNFVRFIAILINFLEIVYDRTKNIFHQKKEALLSQQQQPGHVTKCLPITMGLTFFSKLLNL